MRKDVRLIRCPISVTGMVPTTISAVLFLARTRAGTDSAAMAQSQFPQAGASNVETAVRAARCDLPRNVFPEMNVTFGTYRTELGHIDFPVLSAATTTATHRRTA